MALVWLKSALELDLALSIGGVSRDFVALFLMLFVYHVFEDDRPRERRLMTGLFVLFLLLTSGRFIVSVATNLPIYQPWMQECRTLSATPDDLLRNPVLAGVFRNFLLVTYGWVFVTFFRKWIRFERRQGADFLAALLRPATRPGRALRKFTLAMLALVLLPVATLLGIDDVRAILRLIVTCAVVMIHVDHSQEPTRLRFKLVAIPLAGVVGVLALLLTQLGLGLEADLSARRQAEADRIRALLARSSGVLSDSAALQLDGLEPAAGVRFVLVRPDSAALWETEARFLFKTDDLQPTDLVESNRRERSWRETFSQAPQPFYVRAGSRFYGALLSPVQRYNAFYWKTPGRVYEVGWSATEWRAEIQAATQSTGLIMLATVAFLILGLPFLYRGSVLRPIGQLMQGVERVQQGDLQSRVQTGSSDEFGRLALAFNGMVHSIDAARQALQRAKQAAFRFVPQAFLQQLGQESIVGVELGDQCSRVMTVLFADVRGFTTLAEGMTPDETFAFVNSLLAEIGPVIREHGGFIDKYLGDAVMALFPGVPDGAVAAAVGMLAAVDRFNGVRVQAGKTPIRLGIGIHTGQLTLGIIGEQQRIEGTVIADVVNTASRLEGLTKRYRAGILISAATRDGLVDPRARDCRFVESVQVKGRVAALDIYEVFACDPEGLRASKASSRAELEAGWQALVSRRFREAADVFRGLVERAPDDIVPALHLARAEELAERPPPEDWDAAYRMHGK